MLGKLNQEQMDFVLRSQLIGRIACATEGRVYMVPITYLYDGQHIYARTQVGLKVDMMRQNPHICFEVDIIQDMTHWQCVILQGIYEELSGEELNQADLLLLTRLTPILVSETSLPAEKQVSHQLLSTAPQVPVTFRIRITEKSGRYEKR
jgi:nitroimidazol reductase NimA-like FMN-containing flavoprotein (pyridoxamine 5'-phosphate oxidase superfamily)